MACERHFLWQFVGSYQAPVGGIGTFADGAADTFSLIFLLGHRLLRPPAYFQSQQ